MKKDMQTVLSSPRQRWSTFLHQMKARFKRRHQTTVRQLLPYIPANGTIIDVGANFGYFAKEFARLHNRSCAVICFEPVTYNFGILKKSTGKIKNIRIENMALSNTATTIEIKIPIKKTGSIGPALAHMGEETARDYISESIPAVTLDDYIRSNNIPRVDFIKIDVEGAESLVLEGAKHTLDSHRPSLFCEINNDYTRRIGRNAEDVFTLLFAAGYEAFAIKENHQERVTGYTGGGDYLFVHTSKK
jgi:FkbM family methyltransferase